MFNWFSPSGDIPSVICTRLTPCFCFAETWQSVAAAIDPSQLKMSTTDSPLALTQLKPRSAVGSKLKRLSANSGIPYNQSVIVPIFRGHLRSQHIQLHIHRNRKTRPHLTRFGLALKWSRCSAIIFANRNTHYSSLKTIKGVNAKRKDALN